MRAASIRRWPHRSWLVVGAALPIAGVALVARPAPVHAQQEPVAPDLNLERLLNGETIDLSDLRNFSSVTVDTVSASLDSVWFSLPKVYHDLGISKLQEAPDSWTVGNTRLDAMHHLGNRRLSRYLDCGYGRTGPMADEASVRMKVLTQLQPTGDGRTVVRSVLTATASPVTVSGGPAPCQTTGQLESAIAKDLARLTGGRGGKS